MLEKDIPTLIGEEVGAEMITPRLRRVTVGGDDISRFVSKGPDQYMYLLLPPPGTNELTVDRTFTWAKHRKMSEETRPVGAYYTVRAHRRQRNELDFDMVLHGAHGDGGGHASRWGATASKGDPVGLWGPRTSFEPPRGTVVQYLFADETGVPAVAGILESLDPTVSASAFIEVTDSDDELPFSSRGDFEVTWLHRGSTAGSTTLLADFVRAMPPPDVSGVYVYGGGESHAMTEIRRHVRRSWRLNRNSVSLIAYWRHRSRPGA